MLKLILRMITSSLFLLFCLPSIAQVERCVSHERQKEQLQNQKARLNYEQVQKEINQQLSIAPLGGAESQAFPVVFHVIHDGSPVSDAQIMDQLTQMNDDFALNSADAWDIPAVFDPLAVNTGIQFCLAQTDPSGAQTNGIVKHHVNDLTGVNTNDCWTTGYIDSNIKTQTIWDSDSYINIWVVNKIERGFGSCIGGILGYGSFPGGPADQDGLVILDSTVGSLSNPNPAGGAFALGRTATHELGHYFDLRHIWGDDGGACTGTDFVSDTPNQGDRYFGCPAFPQTSCSTSDMFMNFMDYVDDGCYRMFTQGQSARMWAAVNTQRQGLLNSDLCTPPTTCDPTDTPDFTLQSVCVNGVWKVNVQALDLDPQFTTWQLFTTSVEGDTSDANTTGGPIGGTTSGTAATFPWLSQSQNYYVKHRIKDDCYGWREKRIPVEEFKATPVFNFENESGSQKTSFCFGEDVFLDGTASQDESQYVVYLSRRPLGSTGNYSWYGSLGWTLTPVGLVNLSEEFANNNPSSQLYGGYEYRVTLALANPSECRTWSPSQKTFTVECCALDPSFGIATQPTTPGNYSLTAVNHELYQNVDVKHEWFLLSSPNPGGGPYSLVTASSNPNFTYNQANDGLYYLIYHRVKSICGTYAFIQTVCVNCKRKPECKYCGHVDPDVIDELISCEGPSQVDYSHRDNLITWSPSYNAQGYQVEVFYDDPKCCRAERKGRKEVFELSPETTSVKLEKVNESGCFSIVVRAKCENGWVESEKVCISSDELAYRSNDGAQEKEERTKMIAFPNPSTSEVRLKLENTDQEMGVFTVYGRLGQPLGEYKGNAREGVTVPVAGLPTGTYFFNFQSDKYISPMQKFVVVR